MMYSIMDLVTPQMTSALASRLGGSTTAVQTGLGTGVATVLAAIAHKSGDSSLMNRVFSMISGASSQSILGGLSNLASGGAGSGPVVEQGSRLANLLFGGERANVEGLLARQSGLGPSGGEGIMSVAAPLVMGFLGQHISENGLNASAFASLMATERAKLKSFVPAGLSGILAPGAVGASHASASSTSGSASSFNVGKPMLLVVALAAIGLASWLFSRNCNSGGENANKASGAAQANTAATGAAGSTISALGEFFRRKLADGTELNIPRLGIENRLLDFIEDSSKPVDKTTWFDFDRLLFDTGMATLQRPSQEQLQNIAAILKAYPKVKVKIGGYTDNVGSRESNQKLSQDRATNVMNELVKLRIDRSRMEAEGYGEDHPVADNSTEEGRAQNRRISLRVTGK